jgi:16S rRNA G966 N2-methylase RsmD
MASLTERQARVLAREKAKADAAAAAAAKRASRKKEPKLIVDPPYNPPMSTMPVNMKATTRNSGGIMSPTVNSVYNTY